MGGGAKLNWLTVIVDAKASSPAFAWETWFLDKIAPPLAAGIVIAALGSFLLPRLNEQFKGRREHLNGCVVGFLSELETLQKASSDYWTTAADPIGCREADIEFRLAKLNGLILSVADELWPGRRHKAHELYGMLVLEIVTPDFGSPNRQIEPDRGRSVAAAAGIIASAVLEARRRYYQSGDFSRWAASWIYPAGRILKRIFGWLANLPQKFSEWWSRRLTKLSDIPEA